MLQPWPFVDSVLWHLRAVNVRERCKVITTLPAPGTTIRVVIHVRTGDICLHCTPDYFEKLNKTLSDVLPRPFRLYFESQDPIPWLQKQFPQSGFFFNRSLMTSICNFHSSDILVGTGSSLINVILFGQPMKPILFEESRKEVLGMYLLRTESIKMLEGELLMSVLEVQRLLKSYL